MFADSVAGRAQGALLRGRPGVSHVGGRLAADRVMGFVARKARSYGADRVMGWSHVGGRLAADRVWFTG